MAEAFIAKEAKTTLAILLFKMKTAIVKILNVKFDGFQIQIYFYKITNEIVNELFINQMILMAN